ncbi:unnamed protein product [Linum tenue]|uniref:U3 small nucleolar RNA-associated protein 11 n=1 Tax=Linum tenue TaxID=586396 RepID=A0AAV0LL34_9ROSI|nr:unnamed protein product [Linum tenue]
MSSLKNVLPQRTHKERAQPESRKKFGLLEKHKDYVVRAKAFQKKQETLQVLYDLWFIYFGSVCRGEANKYTQDELMLMKTQDIGYVLQKLQSEKKKVEKLTSVLHSVGNQPSTSHIYFAEDREEAEEIRSCRAKNNEGSSTAEKPVPDHIKRRLAGSYRELEARKNRVTQLEKLYMEMTLQKELQKKGRKRKLREDETLAPTSGPVYKWRKERKR